MNQESRPQGTPPTRAECGSDGSLRGSLAGVKPGRGICVCAAEMYTVVYCACSEVVEGARSLTLAPEKKIDVMWSAENRNHKEKKKRKYPRFLPMPERIVVRVRPAALR